LDARRDRAFVSTSDAQASQELKKEKSELIARQGRVEKEGMDRVEKKRNEGVGDAGRTGGGGRMVRRMNDGREWGTAALG
jgi:hypothetical protein